MSSRHHEMLNGHAPREGTRIKDLSYSDLKILFPHWRKCNTPAAAP